VEPSLLKAISAKHRSKFAALSPVIVTAGGWLKNCSGGYNQKKTKKTKKQNKKKNKQIRQKKSGSVCFPSVHSNQTSLLGYGEGRLTFDFLGNFSSITGSHHVTSLLQTPGKFFVMIIIIIISFIILFLFI
jgi:hypothetical protein